MSPLPPLPPNRQFGFFFSVVFLLLGVYLLWHGYLLWAMPVFFLFGLTSMLTLLLPAALEPFNKGWMRLGMLLGRIISPLVLGLLFFLIITPVALLMRAFGRDALRLKKTNKPSHWIAREPPGPNADSFKNQF